MHEKLLCTPPYEQASDPEGAGVGHAPVAIVTPPVAADLLGRVLLLPPAAMKTASPSWAARLSEMARI